MMGSREGGGPRDQREGICCLSREGPGRWWEGEGREETKGRKE